MSDTGAYSVNSGPLLIRTYGDGSVNNTYLVGKSSRPQYEVPISTNRILITSTNGLLTPSDTIYLSSLTMSSLRGSTMTASTNICYSVNTSTLVASTVTTSTINYSSITGSYLAIYDAVLSESMKGSTIIGKNGTFSTLIGQPGGTITADNVVFNTSINAIVGGTTLTNVNVKNVIGIGTDARFTVPNTTSDTVSTGNLLTTTVSTNILNANMMPLSSLQTPNMTFITGYDTVRTQDITNVASTMTVSTFTGGKVSLSSFGTATPISLTFNGYLVTYSSIFSQTPLTSTLITSTVSTNLFNISNGTYSTLSGSSLTASTLAGSTLFVSTSWGSTLTYSTLMASTMAITKNLFTNAYSAQTILSTYTVAPPAMAFIVSSAFTSTSYQSTCNASTNTIQLINTVSTLFASSLSTPTLIYSTVMGSSFTARTLDMVNLGYSTLTGSTINLSSMGASSLKVSTAMISTLTASSLSFSTCNYSTFYGSSVTYSTLAGTNVYISTLYETNIPCNTMNTATLSISTFTTLTFNTSSFFGTLSNPTVNGITFGLGGGGIAQNTAIGYQALYVNTAGNNNTAVGYQSLLASNTGVYQTAIGASTLSTVTTGSYHTAIGAGAGALTGFNGSYCTYVGYAALPSGTSVINEHVFGGAATNTAGNVGNGNNSITLGNAAVTKNILFGNVGIGTISPQTTLDVRGGLTVYNGNMSIKNVQPTDAVSFNLVSDGGVSSGLLFFLNGSTYSGLDGPVNSATLRNNYGGLRLQAAGGLATPALGFTIQPTGFIGLNQPSPQSTLAITGSMNVTSTLTVNGIMNIVTGLYKSGVPVIGSSPWTTVTIGTDIFSYTGNVGINTTTTGIYGLYVLGTANLNGDLYIGRNLTTNTINSGSLQVNYGGITGAMKTAGLICDGITATNMTLTTNDVQANINGIGIADMSTSYVNGAPVMNYNLYFAPQTSGLHGGLSVGTAWYIWSNTSNTFYIVQPVVSGFTYGAYLLNNTNGWNYMSDERIKEDITPLESCLDRVLQLKPVTYSMKGMSNRYVGFVAQDVQPLFPDVVTESSVKSDEGDHYLGVHHEGLFPYLVQAFQEQNEMVERHTMILNSSCGITDESWNRMNARLCALETQLV